MISFVINGKTLSLSATYTEIIKGKICCPLNGKCLKNSIVYKVKEEVD